MLRKKNTHKKRNKQKTECNKVPTFVNALYIISSIRVFFFSQLRMSVLFPQSLDRVVPTGVAFTTIVSGQCFANNSSSMEDIFVLIKLSALIYIL